jgi:homogentisate 1,2-dioxygenase
MDSQLKQNKAVSDNFLNSLKYNHGFNNYHQTEAELNVLPNNQNSPQKVSHGLYAEQLSGSAFTTSREHTKLTWCYRIQPSVVHKPFNRYQHNYWTSPPFNQVIQSPNQYRWSPESITTNNTIDFISGIKTIAGFGDPIALHGATASTFFANTSMQDTYFSNSDAEMLIILQAGSAIFRTELGILAAHCNTDHSDIIVIPRGVRFTVEIKSDYIRGYLCENYGATLQLPELGVIGANGLANPRHFLYPTAAYQTDHNQHITWLCKYQGAFWQTELNYSPCNVVAWHGNYAPYKYNLNLFNVINTVSFDHPDPSIFTVLTSPSNQAGTANLDFVIFPPRWMVAENSFRPPYFHKNIMSEFMGLIRGEYDAKKDGFLPGGISIHNRMSAHGPDYNTVMAAEEKNLQPEKYNDTLAFMLESNMAWDITKYAAETNLLQHHYYECWQNIPNRFNK